MRNKLIGEFIGTFFLYLTIALAAVHGLAGPLAPVAIGVGLTVLVYSCGHLCRAHFNPAVTLAMAFSSKENRPVAVSYCIVQVVAVLLASVAARLLVGDASVSPGDFKMGPALLAEALFTFALLWVIYNVAVAKNLSGNEFYGLSIGGVVMAGAFAVGPVSGGAFNPAVTIGLCLDGVLEWSFFPAYVLVQVAAAIGAAIVFNIARID